MDSVYVLTQNAPEILSEKEMVLSRPTFLDEVKACSRRKGFSATLGPNYLRAIAEEIGRRYDKYFNPYRNVVPQDFMGRVAETDEQVAEVVHEMFQARYPVIYQRYYEFALRSRPFTIKVIYFTGSADDAAIFQRLGIDQISEDQIQDYLGTSKTLSQPQKTEQTKTVEIKPVETLPLEVELKEPVPSSKELELLASLVDSELAETAPPEDKKPESVKLTKPISKPNRPKDHLKNIQTPDTSKS